jgi:RHS repeat-associated protein
MMTAQQTLGGMDSLPRSARLDSLAMAARSPTRRRLPAGARAALRTGGCWLLLGLLLGPAAARAQHPNIARGFTPSGMFATGGIDSVNGFNGNLVVRIPIGGSYPVGGTMGSYSLALMYNSRAWDFTGKDGGICPGGNVPTDTLAVASVNDNAGLGWRFSLGSVGGDNLPYGAPPPPSLNAYRGMDGSEHYLFDRLTTPQGGSVQQPGMSFSNDGTFLRYGNGILEFPDGMVHTFGANGVASIKDRFGNGLTISYATDPPNCPGNVWVIADGYRTHRVCFRPTGYPYPEQTQVLDHIDLAAAGGATATYRFLYNDTDAHGNGFHEIRMTGRGTQIRGCGDPPWSTRVYLLTGLLLPDGTSYAMPSANYTANASGEVVSGVLASLRLPTSGRIAWDYQISALPQPHADDNGVWYLPVMTSVVGVGARRVYDNTGQLIGQWLYGAPTDIVAHWNEHVSQVVYPSADPVLASQGAPGHRVVTYYSACVYGTCQNEAGSTDATDTSSVDYALPFSRRRPDGNGNFLSQEVYPPGGPGDSTPLRQVYVAYDDDAPAVRPVTLTSPAFYNQRQQAQRTVYLDDPLPGSASSFTAVVAASSGYDGLGHYRTVTVSDTFGFAGTRRTERTGWNPHGMPGPGDPWILDTYDFKEQQEGGDLRRQETVFEPGTAFLLCQRHLAGGGNRGLGDVVVTYAHGSAQTPGQVTAESWFGGDTQTVSTDANCATLPANPVYTASHAYSAGVRNSTTVTATAGNPPGNLQLLDDDVDAASGLVATSRDPAGRPTAFTYDLMGRLLTVSPQGDATTRITYQLSDASPPVVDRQVGSPPLERETWRLDGLGRTVRHTVYLPSGVASTTLSTLNAMGWKTFVSVPAANPDAARGTRYSNYDPFGRPGKIQAPDNRSTTLDYTGARRVERLQRVWSGGSEIPVATFEDYDGLGRLRRVQDPNQIFTRYLYDAGGKLSTVTTNQGQTRSFHYDGRGFLVGEKHPESGLTTYRYDARGNVTLKSTPTGTLTSTYDRAGRLLTVSTAQGDLKRFTYGTGGEAGQLTRASALNYRMTGSCSALEVRQDLAHDPATGRLASESTSLWQGPTPAESWTQSYAYDLAGRITQVNYPSCQSLCPAPPRQLTTAYAYGRPTAVPGFASAITYNDNGTLATLRHANQVVFTQTPDPYGMLRPGSIRADSPAGQPWPREDYFYDGSGNIKAIGTKTFGYDPGSRLTSATLPAAGAQPLQQYSYDLYGNLARIFRGANAGSGSYVDYLADPATNRLQTASYDASGNLLAYQGAAYTWDVLGQATSTSTGAEAWTHTYDAAGERVWSFRTAPSRLDTYALRGPDAKVLTAFTKTGATYTWEDYAYREGQLLGAAFSDGHIAHFDVDHLGSVRLETDANGALTKYRDFWPYGEEATPPSGSERMKFTGHERDLGNLASSADDLDYMHARYYRPIWGRFVSADRHNGSTVAPQTWNRYSFVAGNPLRYTDPTGEYLCSDTSACKKFEDARQELLQSSSASDLLKENLAALGDLGIDNGITVKFGDPGAGTDASTRPEQGIPHFETNSKQELITSLKATVLVRPQLHGPDLESAVVHEGSHVKDLQAYIASFDKQGNSKLELNILVRESERRAYTTSAEVAKLTGQTFHFNGGTFNPAMTAVQVQHEVQRVLSLLNPADLNLRLFAWPP